MGLVAFVEAASSPVKYALFQYCGHSVLGSVGIAFRPASSTSPVKIGAFGGVILTFFYFALLLRKRRSTRLFYEDSIIANLLKEIIYSVLAAFIGVTGCGSKHEMTFCMLSGALGPIVAAVFIIALLGLVVGVIWCVERFRDWRAGYL